PHLAVQRLEHQPVAAERHDHLRVVEAAVAVAGAQRRGSRIGLRRAARNEADPLNRVRHCVALETGLVPSMGVCQGKAWVDPSLGLNYMGPNTFEEVQCARKSPRSSPKSS